MNTKTVRGCTRGLEILRALNEHNYSTALDISRATRLARPTVYRLLETLIQGGFVQQAGERFCITSAVCDLSAGFGDAWRAVEVARARVDEFGGEIGWPLYLHVQEGPRFLTCHAVHSPRELYRLRVGGRVPLRETSPGRAFLASLSIEQRQTWLTQFPDMPSERYDAILAECVQLGCGMRDEGFVPRTCSFALPIRKSGRALAYVTIVFMRSVVSLDSAIKDYLPEMRTLIGDIEGTLIRQ